MSSTASGQVAQRDFKYQTFPVEIAGLTGSGGPLEVSFSFQTFQPYPKIIGLFVASENIEEALKMWLGGVYADSLEIFPQDFSLQALICNWHVAFQDKFYRLENALAGGRFFKGKLVHPNRSGTVAPFRVTLHLLLAHG